MWLVHVNVMYFSGLCLCQTHRPKLSMTQDVAVSNKRQCNMILWVVFVHTVTCATEPAQRHGISDEQVWCSLGL